MPRRREPDDTDIVERIESLECSDRLHLDARDEIVRQRGEMASMMRDLRACTQERLFLLNHKMRRD
jgi:hypothetical protein